MVEYSIFNLCTDSKGKVDLSFMPDGSSMSGIIQWTHDYLDMVEYFRCLIYCENIVKTTGLCQITGRVVRKMGWRRE